MATPGQPNYTIRQPRQGGLLPPRTRPLQINPQSQPANRRDGRYMEFGEIPNPGERPVAPLWERIPGEGGDYGDIEGGLGGGGGARAGVATATTRQVQGNETVADQLRRLTSGNNAYIQGARNRANRASSARGLLSSGMAMGNAESAAIDAALPIAAQDAAWYGRTAADNMEAQNVASRENAGNETQASIAGASAGASLAAAILRSRQDREQAALERNYGRERNIWDSEEGERQDYRREGIDTRGDYRNEGINSRSDYRGEGINARTDYRRYEMDQTADNIRRRNEARDYAYRQVFDRAIDNPEEWDRDQISGTIDYFTQYGDELYDETAAQIYGRP